MILADLLASVTPAAVALTHFGAPHRVGVISLVVLAVAILARYALRLVGAWRWIYVVCAVLAFYLNVFVAVVQAFLKVPAPKALAPTQTESPFLVAQVGVLTLFVGLVIVAAKRFRVDPVRSV